MISLTETNEDYHANSADGSGDIRRMIRSAAAYKDAKQGIVTEVTDALLFGIASHLAMLEPHLFAALCSIKPDGMSFATREGKAWREEQGTRHIVPAADAVHLHRMHQRMPEEVRDLFDACLKEITVRTDFDGHQVQARPDLWDRKRHRFYDLKSTLDVDKVESTIFALRYDVQLQFYRRVIERETGIPISECALIFVEKRSPYRWRIVHLDLDYQTLADMAIDDALAQIAARKKSGCWEDAAPLRKTISPPRYAGAEITQDEDGGMNL